MVVLPNKESLKSMSVAQARTFFVDNSSKFSDTDIKMLNELVNNDGRIDDVRRFYTNDIRFLNEFKRR